VRLHDILDLAVARRPGDPAILVDGRTVTFADLAARVDALARAIAATTPPGARVAVLSENTLEFADAYYAIPRTGRVLVPLNYRLHPREWVSMIERTGSGLVIGEAPLLDALAPHLTGNRAPRLVEIGPGRTGRERYDAFVAEAPPGVTWSEPDAEDTAWVLFTSGTTGAPKGAMLPHRALVAAATNTALGRPVAEDDVYLLAFALCHVAGYNLLIMHLHGRPVVLVRRFEADEFLELTARHRVTNTSLAPTMVSSLLEHPGATPEALASLRQIAYGSASIPPEVLRRAMDRWGCEFAQGYGMTELGGNAVFLGGADHRRAVTDRPELLTAAGRPGPLAAVRVVDDDLVDVPTGGTGEIAVRGPQVFSGYWEDPEATAATIVDGWLRTGDLGRLDEDGYLSVVDRKKDIIVTGGENVASREVEEVLHHHPGVLEVAVIGVPDDHWGEAVCAVVVPRPGVEVTAEQVVATSREHLASYKKPRHVVLVDSLPRNTSGKVMKHVLREQVAAHLGATP
jgi:acyl-CoA synthetase (AMP-forming)/AMP-acid ligase II